MAAFSNFIENEILDHILVNAAYTAPATVYVALFTNAASAAELEAGTLTNEVAGGSYARQSATFAVASSGATSNSADVTFTNMPAVTVSYAAVMDASSAGNVLFHGALTTPKTLNSGDTFTIAAGDFDISLD